MSQSIKALGIMNGTSLDAIDYALISTDESFKKLKFLKHWQRKIPTALKKNLLSAANDQLSSYAVSELHYELGRLYGKHLQEIKTSARFDVVGLHGQTIYHNGRMATSQIGHPGFAHQACQKPVYFDFRAADVIAGGQGAPFAPFFQKVLSSNLGFKSSAFHNLGGISNLTYFKGNTSFAFDTGPANILLDAWMQKYKKKPYDKQGRWAAQGLPDPLVVNQFLKDPYFQKKPPKSTGRELFNLQWINKRGGAAFKKLSFPDQMATLVEVSATSIAQAYQGLKSQPQRVYFYGGGIFNPYLMERIQFDLPEIQMATTDELGWPSQAFEASTFAFLAVARHFHKKVHLPKLTGAKASQHLGSVYGL